MAETARIVAAVPFANVGGSQNWAEGVRGLTVRAKASQLRGETSEEVDGSGLFLESCALPAEGYLLGHPVFDGWFRSRFPVRFFRGF
jgi:hypothetical protein